MQAWISFLERPWLIRGSRWAIGLLFIAAALAKLGNLDAFASQIHNFRMMPVSLENLVAAGLPWIELVAGLALVLGIRARAGAWLSLAMMIVFTVAVAAAIARGLDIDCGCFGTADASTVGWTKLLENLGMLTLAALASIRLR